MTTTDVPTLVKAKGHYEGPASRALGERAVAGAAVGPSAGGGRVLSPDTASDSASSV